MKKQRLYLTAAVIALDNFFENLTSYPIFEQTDKHKVSNGAATNKAI